MAEPTVYDVVRGLAPGQRVELTHEVKVGFHRWLTTIVGEVVRVERWRHGLHYARNHDDHVFSDVLVLKLGDGEETTLTIDEFTEVRALTSPDAPTASGLE